MKRLPLIRITDHIDYETVQNRMDSVPDILTDEEQEELNKRFMESVLAWGTMIGFVGVLLYNLITIGQI